MSSPCRDCPYRKLVCHDHCEEYNSYHEALIQAKESLRKAKSAIDFLVDSANKREGRVHKK